MSTSHHNQVAESHKNEDQTHQKKSDHRSSDHRSNDIADWKKNFGIFKTPAVNINQLISHYRRNVETSATIIQILADSARAVARLQAKILYSNTEQSLKVSDNLDHSTSKTPVSRQADFVSSWLDFNIKSLRDITEISTKSIREAFDVIQKHATEQAKEFVDVASATSHSSDKKVA